MYIMNENKCKRTKVHTDIYKPFSNHIMFSQSSRFSSSSSLFDYFARNDLFGDLPTIQSVSIGSHFEKYLHKNEIQTLLLLLRIRKCGARRGQQGKNTYRVLCILNTVITDLIRKLNIHHPVLLSSISRPLSLSTYPSYFIHIFFSFIISAIFIVIMATNSFLHIVRTAQLVVHSAVQFGHLFSFILFSQLQCVCVCVCWFFFARSLLVSFS